MYVCSCVYTRMYGHSRKCVDLTASSRVCQRHLAASSIDRIFILQDEAFFFSVDSDSDISAVLQPSPLVVPVVGLLELLWLDPSPTLCASCLSWKQVMVVNCDDMVRITSHQVESSDPLVFRQLKGPRRGGAGGHSLVDAHFKTFLQVSHARNIAVVVGWRSPPRNSPGGERG